MNLYFRTLNVFKLNQSQNVRRDFILPVNVERREMVGNVILYFSVLSAAFKLKVPLPPYLPPAEQSRQRLVSKEMNLF